MKNLNEYIGEALRKDFYEISTIDMMDYNVWTPNDDFTVDDAHKVALKFYDQYPANMNDCGEVLGCDVKCQYNFKPMNLFTVFCKDVPMKQRVAVVREIVNFLTNTIYSTAGSDKDIEKMLKKM